MSVAREQRLAGAHPVAVPGDRVDLAVVGDVAVRVRERPGREGVGREPGVHERERRSRSARRRGRGRTRRADGWSASPCRRWSGPRARGSRRRRARARPACAARRRAGSSSRALRSTEGSVATTNTCSMRGFARRAVCAQGRVVDRDLAPPEDPRDSSSARFAISARALAASSASVGKKTTPTAYRPRLGQLDTGRRRRRRRGTGAGAGSGCRPRRRWPPPPRDAPRWARSLKDRQRLADERVARRPRGRRPCRPRRRRARTPGRRGSWLALCRHGPCGPSTSFRALSPLAGERRVRLLENLESCRPGRRWPWSSPSGYTGPSGSNSHSPLREHRLSRRSMRRCPAGCGAAARSTTTVTTWPSPAAA